MNLKASFLVILLICPSLSAEDDTEPAEKSPTQATMYSILATLGPMTLAQPFILRDVPESNWNEAVGVGLISLGILIGPGVGHLYADNTSAFTEGLILRAVGGGLFLAGVSKKESIFDDDSTADFMIFSGVAIVTVGVIRDLVTVDNSARKYNSNQNRISFSLSPTNFQNSGAVMATLSVGLS